MKHVRLQGNEKIYRKLKEIKTAELTECGYSKANIAKIREIAAVYRVDEKAGLVAQLIEGGCVSDCIDEWLDDERTIYSTDF